MAGKNARKSGEAFLSGLTLSLFAVGTLSAQEAAPSAPPLSPACEAPAADIAAPAPLPNFVAALRAQRPLRILAIGSSSTVGIGASSSDKSYPSQFEAILEHALKGVDIDLVNRGVSGEVAEIAAERIKGEVALGKPDLVLWQLGTNDALARVDPAEFEATARSTIRWLKENEVDVVLVGLQYTPLLARDPGYAAIHDSLQRVASSEGVLYVRRDDAMRFIARAHANLQLMSKDNFHLNDLGYQCMAEHVAHAVIVSAFLKSEDPQRKGGARQ
jgi:acyl-CoA thioesterase I